MVEGAIGICLLFFGVPLRCAVVLIFPSAAAVSVVVFHWLLVHISPRWRGLSFFCFIFLLSKTVRLIKAPFRDNECVAEGGIHYVDP